MRVSPCPSCGAMTAGRASEDAPLLSRRKRRRHNLGRAALRPIEGWDFLDRAALRRFQPGACVRIIKGERPTVAHDLLAADKNVAHGAFASRIDQTPDRIV